MGAADERAREKTSYPRDPASAAQDRRRYLEQKTRGCTSEMGALFCRVSVSSGISVYLN